jgi:uncharacterized DUF497 family protein
MLIERLIWLPSVVEKLESKHNVLPEEVEEVFYRGPLIRFHEKGRVQSEHMYTALGQTDGNRYLIVFFIFKQQRQALIVSARDMTGSERKHYERKR